AGFLQRVQYITVRFQQLGRGRENLQQQGVVWIAPPHPREVGFGNAQGEALGSLQGEAGLLGGEVQACEELACIRHDSGQLALPAGRVCGEGEDQGHGAHYRASALLAPCPRASAYWRGRAAASIMRPFPARYTMATYSTNEFKPGLKVTLDGDPCAIMENEFVKPGKGQAFNRVRLRNLLTGRVWERTFKSGESIEGADVTESDMEYLYSDGEFWHFMRTDGSNEQIAADRNAVRDAHDWRKEHQGYIVMVWNGAPISVTPPNFVELEVVETDPGLRGDTATGGTKPAKLSSGAVVKVPLFVEIGDVLRVDTRSGEYVSRAKK